MSLAIDVDKIKAVLLPHVGWVGVAPREDGLSSFSLDAYEYVWGEANGELLLGGGAEKAAGVPATGFIFRGIEGDIVVGPITSILAVSVRSSDEKK